MADPDPGELVRIQQAHHRRFIGLQEVAGDLVGEQWDAFAGLDDFAAAQFTAGAGLVVDQVRAQTSTLAVAYMNANDTLAGFPPELVPVVPSIRNGIPTPDVYRRSVVEARRMISQGSPFDEAMAAGRARAVSTAKTDVTLTNRAEISRAGPLRPWVVGYRRVLTGRSCGFCATASTQRYRSADLLPIHPGCDCDVGEIIGETDPGQIINRELLTELKAQGVPDDIAAARALPDARDAVAAQRERVGSLRAELRRETDQERETRLEKRLDKARIELDAREAKLVQLRTQRAAGQRTTRIVVDENGKILGPDGKPTLTAVKPHGELGQTLTNAKHAAPATAPPAPSAPTVRRTRAEVTDPDVLSEATRRNVSPARVVELREEKAGRRFLEDRARREAARTLSADSPEVLDVAARFGVHPDEVLSARARVATVRKVAREEAARVQAEAIADIDRLGTTRLANPPRAGSRSGMGRTLRRGEWDWLEQISDREKARLSRQWYGGSTAPDQLAADISARLGREVDIDEAVQLWLDANRRAEAAGALRRGKLPSPDAYSDAIDARSILRDLADDGYDPAILFGDDLSAAGHIAANDAQLVQREALDFLGDAANPTEGRSPYQMTYQSWNEDVMDLEHLMREGRATEQQRRRYAELVPQYLDEPDLGFEDLYTRIVATARKAGEEVPDYAAVPW